MPFIGKDWRAPGEVWVRVSHTSGWEQCKLRPIQLPATHSIPIPVGSDVQDVGDAMPSPHKRIKNGSGSPPKCFGRHAMLLPSLFDDGEDNGGENCCLDEQNESLLLLDGSPPPANSSDNSASDESESDMAAEEECWEQPHCFVKLRNRTKEFIGCTSMSEAFQRLDLARAVKDIRRFNYICKVVQILVNEKLQNLSAMSRKSLFAIIQAIVLHSVEADVHITTARDILNTFYSGLDSPHVCGSPQLAQRQSDTCSALLDLIANMPPSTLSEANPESITFLDMPKEVLRQILAKLPDHVSILEVAKANETFQALVDSQIDKHKSSDSVTWRQLFLCSTKYYGLKEVYADLIHICCHCKALFWKDHGHPCVSKETAPSVRVTPQQFVDMLLFL
uniref:F-box domain-containing protein n=1 Tax=Globodera rostochiensis TaxID=31243 RepID=A0A914HAK8_GLORO